MFSGQGSHYYQMGKQLFEEEKTFRKWMLLGNEVVYENLKIDLIKILYDNNHRISESFNCTLYTHPAIFLFEFALLQLLLEKNINPDYVMGISLGELVVAAATQVLSFEEALFAVIKQAEILENYTKKGSMMAILHAPIIFHQENIKAFVELAGINFNSHFIVSGSKEGIKKTELLLQKDDIVVQTLAVSHAFHSGCIDPAKDIYLDSIEQLTFKSPILPWISGCKEEVQPIMKSEYLWEAIRLPMLFQNIIQKLESQGNYIYLDLGPAGTLANFVKYNLHSHSKSQAWPLSTPFCSNLQNINMIKELI